MNMYILYFQRKLDIGNCVNLFISSSRKFLFQFLNSIQNIHLCVTMSSSIYTDYKCFNILEYLIICLLLKMPMYCVINIEILEYIFDARRMW